MPVPIEYYLILCTLLFSIGVIGILIRKNLIVLFMSIELMLNAINLLLVAFSSYHSNPDGQVFVFFVMLVAAAEAAIGLAVLVLLYRNNPTLDVSVWNRLKN